MRELTHAFSGHTHTQPHPPLVGVVVVPPRRSHPSFSPAIKVKLGRANETSHLADTLAARDNLRDKSLRRGWTLKAPRSWFHPHLSINVFYAEEEEEDSAPGNWAPEECLLSLLCTAGRASASASAQGSCVSSGNHMRLLIFIELQEPFFFYFPAN